MEAIELSGIIVFDYKWVGQAGHSALAAALLCAVV
jgi:hypothetical protein